MNYSMVVQKNDDGELYIELPVELLSELGWNEETSLVWVEKDGSIVLKEEVDDSSNEA